MEILNNLSPNLLVFIFLYIVIYLFGYFIIFQKWSQKHRFEASSCLISLFHGTPAVLLATYAIIQTQTHLNFASPNTNLQNTVLEYSIAYFFIDLLHYIVFIPKNFLFIAHHLATLYVIVLCRYIVQHGAFAILVLLVLAEVTSACHNTWSLAGIKKADMAAAAKLQEFLSPLFYGFYSIVRGVFGPIIVYKMGVFYVSGEADDVIPKWVWISWMVVIVSAIFVSILWVLNLWIELYSTRIRIAEKKSS